MLYSEHVSRVDASTSKTTTYIDVTTAMLRAGTSWRNSRRFVFLGADLHKTRKLYHVITQMSGLM